MLAGNCRLYFLRDTTEKQVNIPALHRWAVGDLNAILDTGDITGLQKRDFPSLLQSLTALVSMHCAENQATYDSRVCRSPVYFWKPFVILEKPVAE